MTETTRTVFEKHEIRKSKKQKSAFIDYVKGVSDSYGYKCTIEKGSLGARNIVVGDPESAKVVYTAHYDTCAVLPFPNFITPKNIWIYLLFQIVLVAAMFLVYAVATQALVFSVRSALDALNIHAPTIIYELLVPVTSIAVWAAILWLFMAGPANKHTANDNTSGVTTLLDIMTTLPEEHKEKVAFIFFDLEEVGLVGSSSYASKHPKVTKNTLLINFDCVSDGKNILLALSKKSQEYKEILGECFVSNDKYNVEILYKGVFYPSDQANFKYGVGVASLLYSKRLKTLYMDKIHTGKDTVYDCENIEFLRASALKLAEKI